MKISPHGIEAIKRHEGLRLQAYLDSAGVATVGVGHTAGVKMGDVISVEQADQFLREDLAWVEAAIRNHVKVPLTQNQYDALCSLIFNIGAGGFQESTLLRKLNAGDYAGAADEFPRWNKATVQGSLTVIPGLSTRRTAERALFLNGAQDTPPAPAPKEKTTMPIPAIIAALLPTLIEQIPKLGKLFGSGSEVAERNVAAATTVMEIVQTATGAANAQAAVEAIVANPAVREQATQAVEAQWFQLHQAAEASTEKAREFSVTYAQTHNVRTVLGNLTFLEVLSLLLVVSTLAGGMSVLLWGGIDAQLKGAVVTLMLIGGYTSVTNFWYGSSLGSKKKDDKEQV
jgi:lysozyme